MTDTWPLRVLSLGAGVQSTALLLLSIRGELPRLDCAIFADTQYEPAGVYAHLSWLKGEAERAGIPVHTVTAGNLRQDAIEFRQYRVSGDGKRHASIPLFVLNPDGSQGLIRRQCTGTYKIDPIEQLLKRKILGLRPRQRAPKDHRIDQWFGITWDEAQRMKTSPFPWKRHVYPFCGRYGDDLLPRMWRRADCVRWLETHYPGRPVPRSACICCPYRSNKEWREMRDNEPDSWSDAVRFDSEIRFANLAGIKAKKILVGVPFVHRQMVPLDQADLRDESERTGQAEFGFENECEGMCGV